VWRLGRAPRLSMAERERGGGGCGNAEVRVGEAVVGERGGARGVGEQRDGVEEERVGGGGKGKCSRRRHSDGECVRGGTSPTEHSAGRIGSGTMCKLHDLSP
jgi:hypothetical protein